MKRIILSAAVLVVAGLAAASVSLAAKPFVGTLSVSPDPVAVGGSIDVSGCGFPSEIVVGVSTPAYRGTTSLATDTNGCFALAWTADSGAGVYEFSVYERHDHGASIRLELLNSASTIAVPA